MRPFFYISLLQPQTNRGCPLPNPLHGLHLKNTKKGGVGLKNKKTLKEIKEAGQEGAVSSCYNLLLYFCTSIISFLNDAYKHVQFTITLFVSSERSNKNLFFWWILTMISCSTTNKEYRSCKIIKLQLWKRYQQMTSKKMTQTFTPPSLMKLLECQFLMSQLPEGYHCCCNIKDHI